jgi:hypothetical protein
MRLPQAGACDALGMDLVSEFQNTCEFEWVNMGYEFQNPIFRFRITGDCLMVPANRAGYMSGTFTGYQLKIIQEAITLAVFVVFAWLVLKEKLTWNYAVSFALIIAAVYFATAFKPGGGAPGGH